MLRSRRILHAAMAVGLALFATSCDSADQLQGPAEGVAQFGVGTSGNGAGNGRAGAPGQEKKTADRVAVAHMSGQAISVLVARTRGAIGVTADDAFGNTWEHTLLIGKNTVRNETTFEMAVVDGNVIGVDLFATSGGGARNDVGEAGFKRPPTLCLNVTAADGYDPVELSLAWDRFDSDGALVPIPTYQVTDTSTGDTFVCGVVDHFSRFVVIHN